jgi:hypothetical protein
VESGDYSSGVAPRRARIEPRAFDLGKRSIDRVLDSDTSLKRSLSHDPFLFPFYRGLGEVLAYREDMHRD